MKANINNFFVYGTLRPDIKAPWSNLVHNNPKFKIRSHKSLLRNSKLFMNKAIGYPVCIYDKNKFTEKNVTIGYILETENILEALKWMDEIEEYPNLYDRIVVDSYNLELEKNQQVYFYTLNIETFKMEDLIELNTNDYALI
jgi:gamma-glutamylcyclotransferase (GGCT)/AIG2-like uncharacterized protein YtfP